jgi:hypothetical protein
VQYCPSQLWMKEDKNPPKGQEKKREKEKGTKLEKKK